MSETPRSQIWSGIPMALASAVLFGASAPLAKVLLGSIAPQMLAGLLYLGAGTGLTIIYLGRAAFGIPVAEARLRRVDLPWLAAVVILGGCLAPLLLMMGLQHTSASSGSLLLNLEGLATMAIAWVIFKENVDGKVLVGALAILTGAVILAWDGQGITIDAGGALIAGACLAWGLDNNFTRKLSAADPVVTTIIKGLVAGTVNMGLALAIGSALPPLSAIGAAALVGFFGVGVSLILFVLALRHLGTARTGAYFSLAPFIGAVVAILLLREPLTPQLALAGLLMGGGIWLHLAERHEHDHQHELLEHDHSHVHDEHHRHHAEEMLERHSHWHRHEPIRHRHPHYPDLHHRHRHN
ncbi:MAG: DMT family transporter [Bradyrhizobiaceae bacterium]|nr:MAG: DMT family transporter [Bradyrhizobiaceae bacterium]